MTVVLEENFETLLSEQLLLVLGLFPHYQIVKKELIEKIQHIYDLERCSKEPFYANHSFVFFLHKEVWNICSIFLDKYKSNVKSSDNRDFFTVVWHPIITAQVISYDSIGRDWIGSHVTNFLLIEEGYDLENTKYGYDMSERLTNRIKRWALGVACHKCNGVTVGAIKIDSGRLAC